MLRLVQFPVDNFDASSWLVDGNGEPLYYDLQAVVNHYGRLGSGHYTAYAKDVRSAESARVTMSRDIGVFCFRKFLIFSFSFRSFLFPFGVFLLYLLSEFSVCCVALHLIFCSVHGKLDVL